MTEREEIDMLRRELADLRTRVTKIEADRTMISIAQPAIGLPVQPAPQWNGGTTICACAPGTICGNSACPRRSSTIISGFPGYEGAR